MPGGFVVVASNGVRLAYVYASRRPSQGGLSEGEARAVATTVAALVPS